MPADSRVTQSFPLQTEEPDEPYPLSAGRANPMSAVVTAKQATVRDDFFLANLQLTRSVAQWPLTLRKAHEQISPMSAQVKYIDFPDRESTDPDTGHRGGDRMRLLSRRHGYRRIR
jgi:hypothetical protein